MRAGLRCCDCCVDHADSHDTWSRVSPRKIRRGYILRHSLPRGSGQNGCRIKTDPGVKHAHIWDVTYQDIKMEGVGYTIEVTQNYGGKPGGKNSAAGVHSNFLIEDVRFRKRTTNESRAAVDCLYT